MFEKNRHPISRVIQVFSTLVLIVLILFVGAAGYSAIVEKDKELNVFGYSPLIVQSGSMSPTFDVGDLILVKNNDKENIVVGDIICFKDNKNKVTHRVIGIEMGVDGTRYVTQGDANNTPDSESVKPENIVGKYVWHSSALGSFFSFLKTPKGLIIFIAAMLFLIFLISKLTKVLDNRYIQRHETGR